MNKVNPYESMKLSEYEQKVFFNMDVNIKFGVRYNIPEDRQDRTELIAAIKKYIDVWGNVEFNRDCTKFRKIEKFGWAASKYNPNWKEYDRRFKAKNTE